MAPKLAQVAVFGSAFCAAGCYPSSQGQAPDPSSLYFPTAIQVSAGRSALYLANSDFDLLYSGGTVQVFDAHHLRADVRKIADALAERQPAAEACAAVGLAPNGDPFLTPGPCSAQPVPAYLERAVDVGAFASRLTVTYDPAGPGSGARLFAPVRGDPSLTYFDVDDDRVPALAARPSFRLDCNAGSDGFCGDDHRIGRNPSRSLRGLQLPPDPVGTAASSDGVAIVTAHQTQQAASVVVNAWGGQPYLSYTQARLPSGPSSLAAVPTPAVVPLAAAAAQQGGYPFDHHDAFMLSYQGATEIDVLDYVPDSGSTPPRPFIAVAQPVPLTVSASNADTRGIAVVDSARRACQASCVGATDAIGCNAACAEQVPLKVYAASRTPASLLIGRITTFVEREPVSIGGTMQTRVTAVFDSLTVHESKPLDAGASQVKVGQVVDRSGNLVDRVFVVAFDSRAVFVIDPETDAIETIVRTGRGPQDVAVDSGVEGGQSYSILYIAHFTDSYLGAAELDLRRPINYGQVLASFGAPRRPIEEQPM